MSESVQTIQPFVDAPSLRRRQAARPTTREWLRHTALFVLTALTATLAGILLLGPELTPNLPEPARWLDYISYLPAYYLALLSVYIREAIAHPALLAQGIEFAAPLLAILTAHESGHYIACRRYGVDATLPFFIPAPPLVGIGTFGAFIKIKSPIPSRRALFDIGLAGPLAGFVVAVPVAFIGVLTLQPQPAPAAVTGTLVIFNDPLLFQLIARLKGISLADAAPNAFYMAAWFGALVTSLNLMPVGQLDGGHGIYALFGARAHRWLGHCAFIIMSSLALLGWWWHSSPSGFIYAVLLAVMLRVRHPQSGDNTETLGPARLAIALLTLAVFILCFLPFPITIK
ncbi:MAG TPA: site-2 protease family protein [Pyrinomonadaceae bacterium]|jgi:membrane-associated protease RseP (regulator of RpoE activity)